MACFNERYYLENSKEYKALKAKFKDNAASIVEAYSRIAKDKDEGGFAIPSISEANTFVNSKMNERANSLIGRLSVNQSLSNNEFATEARGLVYNTPNGFRIVSIGVSARKHLQRVVNRFNGLVVIEGDYLRYTPENSDDSAINVDDVGLMAYNSTADLFDNVSNEAHYAKEFADKMSAEVGIEYDIITEDEAIELTAGTSNQWQPESGAKAFFLNGKVFFIGDIGSLSDVVHEFAHPFVRAVAEKNKALFNSVYESIKNTEVGAAIIEDVKALYPELNGNEQMFREEVIVRAIEKSAPIYETEKGNKFIEAIKEFFYAIKKVLRDTFGKGIDISKLSPNTTVKELADILVKGGKINIETELISQSDVVAYSKNYENAIDSLLNVENEDVVDAINSLYQNASIVAKALSSSENKHLDNLRIQLGTNHSATAIRNALSSYTALKGANVDLSEQGIEASKNRIIAFMSSVKNLSELISQIKDSVRDLADDYDNPASLQQYYHYKQLVDAQEGTISKIKDLLLSANISSEDPLFKLLNTADNGIRDINAVGKKIYMAGAKDMLNKQLKPMADRIDARYERILKNYKDKGKTNQKIIDATYKEWVGLTEEKYNRYKELSSKPSLTYKERNELNNLKRDKLSGFQIDSYKIEQMLSGNMGDANYLNSMLEGYMYNNDLVISGLANFIQIETAKALTAIQGRMNSFADGFKPLAEAAGYNPNNIGELGRQVLFLDETGEVNEDGEYVPKKVYSFIDKFKNHRFVNGQALHELMAAKNAYIDSGSAEAEAAYNEALAKYEELQKLMHREYTDEYYEVRNSLSTEAKALLDGNYNKRQIAMNKIMSELAYIDAQKELDAIDFEYRQMFSLTYPDGTYKPVGSKEYNLAIELNEYRNRTKDMYEDWQLDENMFEDAYNQYSQHVTLSMNIEYGSERYKAEMNKWVSANTRVKNTEDFYTIRNGIINTISKILNKIEGNADARDRVDELYKEVFAITTQYRGSDGIVSGAAMPLSAVKRLKALQEKINAANEEVTKFAGLTKDEGLEYDALKRIKDPIKDVADRLAELESKIQNRNSADEQLLANAIQKLIEMSSRQPTEEYVDIVNQHLSNIKRAPINEDNAFRILSPSTVDAWLEESAAFKEWWDNNHVKKKFFNTRSMQLEERYERIPAWNVTKPSNDKYIEKQTITDSQGNKVTLNGIPKLRFYKRVVKDKYKTEEVVGKTVNNKGEWLPKDIANSPYRNEDYYAMQKENPSLFSLMEYLKEFHLANQEGSSDSDKLYLDSPRFIKSGKEALLNKKTSEIAKESGDFFKHHINRSKEFFMGSKEDAEKGFNFDDEVNFIEAEYFDTDDRKLAVYGLYDIDSNDVSMDVTSGLSRYMMSLQKKNQYREIMPWVRSVQNVVSDPKNAVKEFKKDSKRAFLNKINIKFNKKDQSVRQRAINNMIERDMEGQSLSGRDKDWKGIHNVANFMFKSASFNFFAMNIPSALKNSFGAMFQGTIEAIAGQHYSPKDLARGTAWATKAMMNLSFSGQLQERGAKNLIQQTADLFDFSKDRTEKESGANLSRNTKEQFFSTSFMMSPRRWTELSATFSIGSAMAYNQIVEQTLPDGTKVQLPLLESFEIVNGRIQSKEGIDKEWAISYDSDGNQTVGEKFLNKRKEIHQVLNNLQGAYAKLDQPEAQRYMAYRFIMFIKRFFTPMAINRFGMAKGGRARYNVGLNDVHTGFYTDTAKTLLKIIRTKGAYASYMQKEEAANVKRALAESMMLFMMGYLLLGLGWDDDDADRENFAKMRARSGALPSWFTNDKKSANYDTLGFLQNHAIYLMYSIRAENEQFLPNIRGMKNFKEMITLQSASIKPTIGQYLNVAENMWNLISGDDKAYYKRDVGPYRWQEKGDAKLASDFLKIFGLNGYSVDPNQAMRGLRSAENMK